MRSELAGLVLFIAGIFAVSGCGNLAASVKSMDSALSSYKPCTMDAVTTEPCLIEKPNVAVGETLGSDLSSFVNTLGGITISAAIPNGFYDNKSVSFTDGELLAANILSGVEIFGVTGTATGPYAACTDNALNAGVCSTVTNRYVTGTLGPDISVYLNPLGGTTISAIIPDAFYQNRSVTFTDANLLASNIVNGVNIFGVTGTAAGPYAACSENSGVLNAAACSTTGAGRYVSSTAGADVTSWSNSTATTSVTATIPDAYYFGKYISFSDTNLLPINIINGVQIFGVTGTATGPYAACTDNALNAGVCSTVTNRYVTGTQGTNVSAWSNVGGTTTVGGAIPLGYYAGNSIDFTDANLVAANIRSGVSIFNVTGNYTAPSSGGVASLKSNMHRDWTTTQMTQVDESTTNAGTVYTNADPGYRAIPRINKDDDGYTSSSVTPVVRTNWDTSCDATTGAAGGTANSVCKCGLSGTLEQRITDCDNHGVIGSETPWDGAVKGNAGQGVWKLVTRTGAAASTLGREVWRDEQTQLLWSSLVSGGTNWCKATGSNNITGNPVAEVDPSGYCGNAAHTVTSQNNIGKAVSACFEDDGTYFTTDATITNSAGKGGLGRVSAPVVGWRVPTIYDYHQANTNGFRFVMPDTISRNSYEWSASVYSFSRTGGWEFKGGDGQFAQQGRALNNGVRCVGR